MDLVIEQNCRFGNVVKGLMHSRGIKATELARQIQMPQTTINRIILGHTENPMASTLLSLAEYFDVSVDYLLGRDSDRESTFEKPSMENSLENFPEYIPLIEWDSLKNRGIQKGEILSKDGHQQKIAVSCLISSNAFALRIDKAYSDGKTIFPKGSILVVDTVAKYNSKDYIVVSINRNFPTIREICEESGKCYLHPIGLNIPAIELESEHVVFGKILECRTSF